MLQSSIKLEQLASENLGRLLLRYSWPALVAMSLNALYAVVDRLYIGRGCGEAAMAGIQLSLPVMMLFTAFGVFIGVGHSTLLSIRLGERDADSCERIIGELVTLKVLFSLLAPPLVFFNIDKVLGWCGAGRVSSEAFAYAKEYLSIVVFSQVFSHIAFGLSAAMRAEGSALRSMFCMVVGFGVNLVLDPIFIFWLDMGVAGAAWATNVAMVMSCVFAFRHYWSGRSVVRLRLGCCRIYRSVFFRTSALGFAPFVQNLLSALISMSLGAAFAKWAVDDRQATQQLASLGVFSSMLILCIMPIMGAQQGLQPIFGYNWGARNYLRVRKALVLGFWVTTSLCCLGWIVQVVPPFSHWSVGMFVPADNPELLALSVHDLAVSNCMIWCIGLNVVATTYFLAIGHPATALLLSVLRQGVVLLPCVWILPHLMEDHALAIWLGLPISDVVCQLATIPPLLKHTRFLRDIGSRKRHRKIVSRTPLRG